MITAPALHRCVLAGALLVVFAPPVYAQDFERIAPKELPANPRTESLPAPPLPQANGQDGSVVILPALKGLVFVARADQLQRQGIGESGVRTNRVNVLDTPDFRAQIEPYLGQPVTIDRLNEITRLTVVYFREHDHPLVDVIVPEQDISSGTVQILALEFLAGSVRTEGNRWFSDQTLLSEIRTASGERISAKRFLEDVNWLNQNPFRRVDLVYQRSAEPGRSDIVLRTTDRFPLRVFGGVENTGTQSTARNRTFAGFNWGNALWMDHQLSYQFTASPDFWGKGLGGRAHFASHSGSYFVPLPWRHKLTVFGSYAESLPEVPESFQQIGRSSQVSMRYAVPLSEVAQINHEIQAGFDWKRTNNNLEFGGSAVSKTATDIVQWMIGYSASRPDDWGVTGFSTSLFSSPGGLGDKNSSAAFQTQRAGAEARYTYGRIGLDRLTKLPEEFSWLVRVQGQLANRSLLPSEQLGFGGEGSLRGYDERQVNGDQGFLFTNELRTPEISVLRSLVTGEFEDKLQLLAFWDYGIAQNRSSGATGPNRAHLSSVGVGFRYSVAPYVTVKFDYGWQLIEAGRSSSGNSRPHFGVTMAF